MGKWINANISPNDGCTAELYEYYGNHIHSRVSFYKVTSGEHTWPDAPFDIAVTNHDFNATQEIWNFFNQFEIPVSVAINDLKDEIKLKFFPNPFTNNIKIQSKSGTITIYDSVGKVILIEQNSSNTINTSSFSSGIYFIKLKTQGQTLVKKMIKE